MSRGLEVGVSPLLKYRRLVAVAQFLAMVFAVFRLTGLSPHFTLASLRQNIRAKRPEGLLVFVLLCCLFLDPLAKAIKLL